ncbi:zinc-binding dehydrogenase [bacterium]|nr:MAG: zinc-binding dehydrogenase [bacterium]
MLQVIQNYKSGELKVEDVPEPSLMPGGILVRNVFSLISSGTEKTTVETAQKSLVGKAQSRPDLVKKVMAVAKREGLLSTFRLVKNKLDTQVPMGYSSAGVVTAVAPDVDEFAVGDRVACAGQGYASHAETIFVPRNLAVKIPVSVELDEAAFTTLGAIAMQGVRQAQLVVGEKVAVIGLGLIGLITVQILKASGCIVTGFDIDSDACSLAKELGADYALLTAGNYLPIIEKMTDGYGVDCAIITASTKTNLPVILAGDITRNKGSVVIVGGVPADVPRSPFYEKEIDIRFSRSYGPGRYDTSYEEKGLDYPYGYVRWTENRNMQSFLQLTSDKKIDLKKITSHRFRIEDANKAYQLITGKTKSKEKFIGILLEYDHRREFAVQKHFIVNETSGSASPTPTVRVGFIGAGNFAQNYLLPVLKKDKRILLSVVSTSKGLTSTNAAKKFKFLNATTDNNEILQHGDIDCVFITTRHHLHAPYVIAAMKQNKAVFVEKPLALNYEQLLDIIKTAETHSPRVMVGFNRRFAPTVVETKKFFSKKIQPCVVTYRVNAGFVPKEHWSQDPVEGGGRIIGEVCHFVDLINYLIGSTPIKVYAEVVTSTRDDMMGKDNTSITFKYRDGSIASIIYTASGDKSFPKERIEIFNENSVAVIDDFCKVTFSRNGKTRSFGGSKQDKGYKFALNVFIESVLTGSPSPISLQESVNVTIATLKILESLSLGIPVDISLDNRQEFLNGLSRIHTESLQESLFREKS